MDVMFEGLIIEKNYNKANMILIAIRNCFWLYSFSASGKVNAK